MCRSSVAPSSSLLRRFSQIDDLRSPKKTTKTKPKGKLLKVGEKNVWCRRSTSQSPRSALGVWVTLLDGRSYLWIVSVLALLSLCTGPSFPFEARALRRRFPWDGPRGVAILCPSSSRHRGACFLDVIINCIPEVTSRKGACVAIDEGVVVLALLAPSNDLPQTFLYAHPHLSQLLFFFELFFVAYRGIGL